MFPILLPHLPSEAAWLLPTTALRRFRECVRGDLPVHEVTKAHVRDFKQAMMRLSEPLRTTMEEKLQELVASTLVTEGVPEELARNLARIEKVWLRGTRRV